MNKDKNTGEQPVEVNNDKEYKVYGYPDKIDSESGPQSGKQKIYIHEYDESLHQEIQELKH